MPSRLFALALLAASASAAAAQVQVVPYSTNFNAPDFTDGPLVGQNGWTITGTTTTNALAVSNTATNGIVSLTTSGQDAQRGFTAVTSTQATSVFLAATVTVSAAGTGDYALHFTDGGSNNFYGRTYFKSSGAGFQLALGTSSGAGVTYGATVLNFGQSYRLLARYDFVTGAANDTGALYVDPTTLDGSGDTAYVAATTIGTDANSLIGFAAVALRQGMAGSAATLTVSDIATYYFTPVPEPATMLLVAAAGLAGVRRLRRRG